MTEPWCPTIRTNCADCGAGTHSIDEWYMVRDEVWEQAWVGRRKSWQVHPVYGVVPGQEILCIGCLEKRIGRALVPSDFTDAPVNDPLEHEHSERLMNRLGWA